MALTKKQISRLRELRRYATFESAAFDHCRPDEEQGMKLPTKESEVTDFIRNRTWLYRHSWILPIIDELLRSAQPKTPA